MTIGHSPPEALYERCGGHAPPDHVLLALLLLNFQGEAGAEDALQQSKEGTTDDGIRMMLHFPSANELCNCRLTAHSICHNNEVSTAPGGRWSEEISESVHLLIPPKRIRHYKTFGR